MLNRMRNGLEAIAACMLFVTMTIAVADVVLRYFLSAPLLWAFDLFTIYLLSTIYFFALSSADAKGDHIAVDLIDVTLSPRVRRVTRWLADLVLFAVVAAMTVAIIDRQMDAWRFDRTFTSAIVMPVWTSLIAPVIGLAALGFGVAGRLICPPPAADPGNEELQA